MNEIDLKKIIYCYNQIYRYDENDIYNYIRILNNIYEHLGEKLEDFDEKNTDIYKFFIDRISEVTKKILENLDEEEKETFLKNVPEFIKISILNDEEKISRMDELEDVFEQRLIVKSLKYGDDEKIKLSAKMDNEELKYMIIEEIQDDDKKIAQLENVEEDYIVDIIISIKDDDKKIELLSRYNFLDGDLTDIIKSLKDDNKKIKLLDKIIAEGHKAEVIRTLKDDEKKISCLDNIKEENNKVDIILSFKDDDKKISLLSMVNTEFYRAYIICGLKDDDKKITLLGNITNEKNRADIIRSLEDDDKKLSQLDSITDEKNRTNIILSLEDDDKKISSLEGITDEKNRTNIILSLQDDDKKIGKLDGILNERNIVDIIKSLQDDDKKISNLDRIKEEEYKVEIIVNLHDDDKKISQLGNIPYEGYRAKIIESMHDDDKKITLMGNITNEKNRIIIIHSIVDDDKKISLLNSIKSDDDRLYVIESIYVEDKIIEALQYLENEENKISAARKIKDDNKRMKVLSKINGNFEAVYKLINEVGQDADRDYKYKELNLPSKMTVGIEIEAMGDNLSCALLPKNIKDWECKYDATLGRNGEEYVSPIMHDKPSDVKDIYRINEILQRIGMQVTSKCGGHVHIGADYIKSESGFRELIELWGNAEEVYYLISNKPQELPREGVSKYAHPISNSMEDAGLEDIPKDEFIEDAKNILGYDRYRSLNLMNINNGKNTIEFRLSNGTLDANTWIENIRLYGRTVQIAEKLGEIVDKLEAGEELTEDEKTKYALKEMLKGKDLPLDAKMEILMQILFSKEEREVYQERYDANKSLDRKEHVVAGLQFGKVDFKKVYDEVKIPEGIISKMQDEEKEEQSQR